MKVCNVADKRKRAMPKKLRDRAAQAKARHQQRAVVPDLAFSVEAGSFGSPYRSADDAAWASLLFEAFGTRMGSVAHVFILHLARLCSADFDQAKGGWAPNEDELQAAIAIVQSLAPRNEAEAALAAQAVAVHFAAMKMGKQIATMSYPDPRTVAALAALGKVYAGQLETMQKLQGRKTVKQRITVRYERHNHNHQHVHIEGGGGSGSGGQAQEPCDDRNSGNGNNRRPLIEHEGSASVSRSDAAGNVVPMSRKQRQG